MKTRLAFVVNHAAFFISHRLPIAVAALERDYAVDLYTGLAASPALEQAAVGELSRYPIAHWRVQFTSSGLNPLSESAGILELKRHFDRRRPDIVHGASPKGVIYGGIAARLAGVPAFVAAVSGQGYAQTAGRRGFRRSLARVAYAFASRRAFRHRNKRVIVQNADDRASIVAAGLASDDQVETIPGSGVALELYVHRPIDGREPLIVLPARMLRDKGVVDFVEAAAQLRARHPAWRFLLAGTADYENPTRIEAAQLADWQQQGIVAWLGHVDDMPSLYARASIVCLPSYREGMPKALLEAAAAGCAVVTTDVTGCRDAIEPGVTGDLVPAGDSRALARSLEALIEDRARRMRYGAAGRRLALERFDVHTVIARTLAIYDRLLEEAGHGR